LGKRAIVLTKTETAFTKPAAAVGKAETEIAPTGVLEYTRRG
jgi:hypothetical protein